MEFKQCPQSYLFQYLYGLRQPPNQALAKGSMCHEALEKVFDLDPNDRSLETLQNLFRSSWQQHRLDEKYKDLFHIHSPQQYNVEEEREWGQSALKLLENYVPSGRSATRTTTQSHSTRNLGASRFECRPQTRHYGSSFAMTMHGDDVQHEEYNDKRRRIQHFMFEALSIVWTW